MKRGEPLKRTTPLVAKTGLRRSTSMAQKAGRESLSARGTGKSAPRKVRRAARPTAEVVDAVLDRDHYSCVVCGMGVGPEGRGVGWSIHHRLRRSQAVDHTVQNLITACGSGTTLCHGRIHAEPAAARAGGWMLSGRQEPLAIPVLIAGERWVYLTSTGLYHDVKEQAS
jgi:hypothetical protein